MPEGDSLVRLADRLRPVLEGQRLLRTDFRVPRLATLDLSDSTVGSVRPRAKYLLFELEAAEGLTVLSHLKMEGSWETYTRVDGAGSPITPRWRHPGWQARCVVETARHQVVGFQLGLLEVLPTAEVPDRLAFLGPDLLDPEWEAPDRAGALSAEAVRRLLVDPERPIGLALLDQRLVSGIGNIYRCEALLLAGLDPHRPVSSVPDLPGLVDLARGLMRANTVPTQPGRPAPRRTTTGVVPDVGAPYGVRVTLPRAQSERRNTPLYWVYGRHREGCLRCGGPVAVGALGDGTVERTLYWCRQCQR
ncbi:formamidopyrimidine-DNA glycosylase [Cellulosimicrobium funkei]|nr:formamidopyrimidine-DNA glycosylase [Cellulosimicrobium funkei]